MPVINATGKTVTANGTVRVKVGGMRLRGGERVLTSGGKFTGVNVALVDDSPDWALGLRVNEAGEIVLDAKVRPFIMMIR